MYAVLSIASARIVHIVGPLFENRKRIGVVRLAVGIDLLLIHDVIGIAASIGHGLAIELKDVMAKLTIIGAGKVAIIGQTVARELFGESDPVDQIIRVRGVPFTVIGLLEKKGQSMMGQDQDDIVIMPLSTARNKIFGALQGRIGRVSSIFIKAHDGVDMTVAEERVRDLLRQRHRLGPNTPDDFSLRNLTEILQAQEAASKVMSILLAAVASVSLLVGGIGIMNIMLVSVTERTREIGLRLAVGARGKDILSQFLVEAITLSTIGGILGILLGGLGTWLVAELAEWRVELSILSIILAVGFSAMIGIFFGYYPARKASAMQPIQALRYE